LRHRSYRDLSDARVVALNPERYQIFSDSQFASADFRAARFTDDLKLDWIMGHDLKNSSPIAVPAELIFIQRGCAFPYNTTNGVACGTTRDQAILSALLEVIERDAFVSHWWTSSSGRELEFDKKCLPERVAQICDGLLEDIEVLVLETDVGIPVLLSIWRNPTPRLGPAMVMGAACCLDPVAALTKSLFEMRHCRAMAMLNTTWKQLHVDDFDRDILSFKDGYSFYYHHENAERTRFLKGPRVSLDSLPNLSQATAREDLRWVVRRLIDLRMNPVAVDISSREVQAAQLYVYRVFVPELIPLNAAHRYRPWGHQRLFKSKLVDLNPLPHPFP
jgi:ribosomal protein S12 methylthiotransferase accessory factor